MPNLLSFMFCLRGLLLAQIQPPPPPPPPPPAKVAPKPVPPQRIRVGDTPPQQAYRGPAALWFLRRWKDLSDEDLAKLEQNLSDTPEDICTRGQLIATTYPPHPGRPGLARIHDLLWMIEHHPDWDGFLLYPRSSLARPKSNEELDSYGPLRDAWLRQVGPDQRSGAVLHNAALFFAIREPDFAATLLQRAIRLEPDVPLHVERLGMVYVFLKRSEALLASDDWILVAGALAAIGQGRKSLWEQESTRDLVSSLVARLKVLTGEEDTYTTIWKLPSHSGRYSRTTCDAAFPRR